MNQGGRVSIYQNEKLQIYQIKYQVIYLHTKNHQIHKNLGQKFVNSEDKTRNKRSLQSYRESKGREKYNTNMYKSGLVLLQLINI